IALPSGGEKHRGTELVLLVFALVLTLVAFTSVSAAFTDALPSGLVEDGIGFAALALVAHLAIRWFAPYADPVLLPAAAALNGIGLVVIHRLDLGVTGHHVHHNGTADAPLQLVWTVVGVVAFVVV